MDMSQTLKSRRGRLIALGIVGAAVIATIALFMILGPRGTVTITIPNDRSRVFIDNDRKAVTDRPDETLTFRLSPGEHEIIISRDGHWPWFKNINITEDEVLVFNAFSVPEDSNPAVMPKDHSDFPRIVASMNALEVPTRERPSLSRDKNIAMWVNPDNNGVYAEWRGEEDAIPRQFCELGPCDRILPFFNTLTDIRNVSFMNARTDVAIVATDAGIYLVEITKMPFQNFQPLYIGTAPQFSIRDETSIYIYDDEKLMVVTL